MTKMKPTSALLAAIGLGACAPVPDQLVINEVDYDQPGVDVGEFIEIYNAGDAATELSEFSVRLINGANGTDYGGSPIALPSGTLPAGGYYVLCVSASEVPGCDAEVLTELQNGAPDAVALFLGETLIDSLSYEGDTPGFTEGTPAGADLGLDGVARSLSRCGNGVDTDDNAADFAFTTSTPGAANRCERLRINEVDYDQPGTDTTEFVELFNAGSTAVDLSQFSVEYVRGDGTTYETFALPSVTLPAGGYFVLCNDDATVPACDLPTGAQIQNGAPDALALYLGTTLVDSLSYEGDVPGFTEGSSAPDDAGEGSLSRCPDGADTDDNGVDFVVATATAGAANDCP